jgi:hypothetical protein
MNLIEIEWHQLKTHELACIIHEDFGKSSKALARSSSSDLAEKQSVF